MQQTSFDSLKTFLARLPGIKLPIGSGRLEDGGWWVKFSVDISHKLAWHVVQALGHVLNYLSLNDRLPTLFTPVSPPPYLNGGPDEFLSWVIECRDDSFTPDHASEWMEGRLPNPVENEGLWLDPAGEEDGRIV